MISLTPGFSQVRAQGKPASRFNGFGRAKETFETVWKDLVGNHPAKAGC